MTKAQALLQQYSERSQTLWAQYETWVLALTVQVVHDQMQINEKRSEACAMPTLVGSSVD